MPLTHRHGAPKSTVRFQPPHAGPGPLPPEVSSTSPPDVEAATTAPTATGTETAAGDMAAAEDPQVDDVAKDADGDLTSPRTPKRARREPH